MGQKKDPCGTSKSISLQELYVLIILTLCLLFLKHNCKSFKDSIGSKRVVHTSKPYLNL